MTAWRATVKRIAPLAWANAALKATAVEHRAAAIYQRYEAEANRRSIRALRGAELRAAVRQRIEERAAHLRWPRPKGCLHLFLVYSIANWEVVLPDALAPFGEVSAFEWRSRGFREDASNWLDQRDRMNAAMLGAFREANARRPIDVVVCYVSGYTASPEMLRKMAAAGAVITNFCFDDKHTYPGTIEGGRYWTTAGIASAIDLNLTSDPNGILKYAMHGGLAMFHPEAALPSLHKSYDLPFAYDVSFIGANYGWRPHFIRRLKRLGIEIFCFGPRWPSGPVSDEDMGRIYSQSRVNLGFGGVGHSRKLLNLKGRDFEVPMSGGLYVTQDNPELKLVYDVGREIVTFRDENDCAEKIRALLADPERAANIRGAGQARALRDHTYEARWSHVLRVLGALE